MDQLIELLNSEGVKGVLPPSNESDEVFFSHVAWVFLGFLAHKTKIPVFLNARVAASVASALKAHSHIAGSQQQQVLTVVDMTTTPVPSPSSSPSPDLQPHHRHPPAIKLVPQLAVPIARLHELRAVAVPGMFSIVWECLDCAIRAVSSPHEAQSILEYLETTLTTTTATSSTPFSWGAISVDNSAFIYNSSFGSIQIGLPPLLLKQALEKGTQVPTVYVLPSVLYSGKMSYAEVEFPVYFNHFVLRATKLCLIGTPEQIDRVKVVFQESVFGPEPDLLEDDISPQAKAAGYQIDLNGERDELAYKEHGECAPLSSYVRFVTFDAKGVAKLTLKKKATATHRAWAADEKEDGEEEGELMIINTGGLLQFYEDDRLMGLLDSDFTLLSPGQQITGEPPLPLPPAQFTFKPPRFGVTFLGTSHGFDKNGRTTGFILWSDSHGIVVDPPFSTLQYLHDTGAMPFVTSILLTHVHGDHDAGVLRLLLAAGHRMTLYTTKTIHRSYLNKVKAITGQDFTGMNCYDLVPVRIGEQVSISGAVFEFDYSFHTIPTIGFLMTFGGHSISYSADTKYDPSLFLELVRRKVMTPTREASLRMRGFDADLIIHEMGVPPIHTEAAVLNNLPTSIKKKMVVVHCSGVPDSVAATDGKTVPIRGIRKPKEGLENTIVIQLSDPLQEGYSLATFRLNLLGSVPCLESFNPSELAEVFSCMKQEHVQSGERIIFPGAIIDHLYLLEHGKVQLTFGADGMKFGLATGDTFGESALMNDKRQCSNTAVAITNTTLLTIPFSLLVKHKPSFYHNMFVLNSLIHGSTMLRELSKQQLEIISRAISEEVVLQSGEVLMHQGDTDRSLFIIKSGLCSVERTMAVSPQPSAPNTQEKRVELVRNLGPGEIIGEIGLLLGTPRNATIVAHQPTTVLCLKREAFEQVMKKVPSITFALKELADRRMADVSRVDTFFL